ncbi:Sarcosine oxidase alpha subunit [Caballeronia sordidicola]|uniref:Sarcosine oxidase alpha subunit n=1 Tax=Caballeronia sordidicola TaxID=196367 RepID=A0A226WR27_CABSO|nr:Sarcosine oxidase alpha subunit [Caballeronia sordidicola]
MEYDPASVAGKQPPIADETDLLVIGAGPAGLAAALAASNRGVRVTLIDENPVPFETMGEEIPLHFGSRMGTVVANRNAMLEALLESTPVLADALEAGVDVRLGTIAWGLFPQRPTAAWIDGRVAGLADENRAYLMRFKQVIVASGSRDMGLAFPGWERPGVMGAGAAYRLAMTYDALSARVAVVVGSSTATLQIANALADKGVRIAAVIEQGEAVTGDAALLAQLVAKGTQVLTGHVIERAEGATGSGDVEAVTVAAVDANGRHRKDELTRLACDTVLLGIATVPAIELLEAAGCDTAFIPERSGHVARIDEAQRTSLPFVLAAGDCAGTWTDKTIAPSIARREGRIAAAAALSALGVNNQDVAEEAPVVPNALHTDSAQERCAWVRASVIEADGEPYVCQCEEVTAAEILSVRPPRYIGWETNTDDEHPHTLAQLAGDGPPNPDIVKRLTRACMGPCQGRRCREQVAALLSIGSGTELATIPLATFRSPVRPLPLRQLAALEEVPELGEHWDSWFGMASQWVPFWRPVPLYTAAGRERGTSVASE